MTVYTYSRIPAFNPNTNPASVAKSASGSVYDPGDIGFLTPLNLTLVATNTVTTTLYSDSNGMFPDFTLDGRTQCAFKSGTIPFILTTTTPIPGPPSTVAGPTGPAGPATTDASLLSAGTVADARLPVTAQAATLAATYATAVLVTAHGAKGDGATDDTAAIQSALNTGQAVYFPAGTYLSGPLVNTSGKAVSGAGMNDTIIRATPGTATLYTATQLAGMRIENISFDGNGNAATCLDTSWTIPSGDGAPSLNCKYTGLRVSGYTSLGWKAKSNNDCTFSSLLIEASGTNVGLRLNAPGGLVSLNEVKSFAPIEIASQSATLTACVTTGVTITEADYNTVNILGGYVYPHPVTHKNYSIASGITAYPMNISGAHIENGFADGKVFGGPGSIQGQSQLVGCHVFGVGAGADTAGLIATDLGGAGLVGRFNLIGGIVEHLVATSTSAFRVLMENVNQQGLYADGSTDWANPDGGSRTTIRQGGIFHDEGVGEGTSLAHRTVMAATSTPSTIATFPRSGLISIRGTATDSPALLAAYNRIGSSAGTVTVLASFPGAAGSNLTLTIPSGNAQATLLTDLTVSHDYGSTLFLYCTVLGN